MFYAIDRFEEGIAVLIGDDGAHREVPVSELPAAAAPGDVLRAEGGVFEVDSAETAHRQAHVKELLRKLWDKQGGDGE